MGRYISNINTNSYQDNELSRLKQGFAKNRKEFLTAGTNTWTIDHDVIARVRVWGGGGGGGGGGGYPGGPETSCGGGGGAGGAVEAILRLNAGTYNITVGASGSGGRASGGTSAARNPEDGKAGGSSSFHTYITCSGGNGGPNGLVLGNFQGGLGGSGSFNTSGFDGFLYIDVRSGGAGGFYVTEGYMSRNYSVGATYSAFLRCERGEGESGGRASYIWPYSDPSEHLLSGGGGGGGYNPPFIYGSGRGVGTGGTGGTGTHSTDSAGEPGQTGAVVIEWN